MADHGYKSIAVIPDTPDYGKGHDKYFTQFFTKAGGKIVSDVGVTADQQDFTAGLTQIKALSPHAVYFGGLTPIAADNRAQKGQPGRQGPVDGNAGLLDADFLNVPRAAD